jgi:hypothetical protein
LPQQRPQNVAAEELADGNGEMHIRWDGLGECLVVTGLLREFRTRGSKALGMVPDGEIEENLRLPDPEPWAKQDLDGGPDSKDMPFLALAHVAGA